MGVVIDPVAGAQHDPGGSEGTADVPDRLAGHVVDAAEDCPGECIFLEADS